MGKLVGVYLQNSLQLSIIALLIFALSPLLARRYSAKCRYYVWVIIFVALILPVRAKIALTLPEAFQPSLPQSIHEAASGTAAFADTVKVWDWHSYAGLLWVAGVLCFLSWHLFQHLRFLSAVRRWSEDVKDFDVLEQFRRTKRELKIRNRIAIKSCACIKTPMVIGLLHPVVLLPQIDFSRDDLPLILKHELVHYKRNDLWYKVLILMASAIHWFNPVVHIMVRSALTLCEISCDEEVLKKCDARGRAQYGEAIIGVVRSTSAYHTALSTNFYSGTNGMKKRIYAMMDMTRKRFSPILLMAVFMITVCGTTAFVLSPAQAENISRSPNNEAAVSADKRIPDSGDSSVQPSFAAGAKQDNQESENDNNRDSVLPPTPENTSAKQPNEIAGVSNKLILVSGDLQFSENTPAKLSQAQPQNLDTNRLIADNEQP